MAQRITKYRFELDLGLSCGLSLDFQEFIDLTDATPVLGDMLDSWFSANQGKVVKLDYSLDGKHYEDSEIDIVNSVSVVVAIQQIIGYNDPHITSKADANDICFFLRTK